MMKHVFRVISLYLVFLAVASGAHAQTTSAHDPPMVTNKGEAIPVGPFLFSPALQLTWQHRDNIFFTPDNEVADEVYLARASLVFELPIYESYVRFAYTPVFREYADYELQENWSHFFDLSGNFEFANGLVLDAIYRFVRGSMETREVDPGDELIFGDRPFKKNFFRAGLDYWFTPRDGISLVGDYTDVAYDDPLEQPAPGEGQFFDYQRAHYGIGWVHQLTPVLTMDVMYGRIDFEPANTFAWRTSTSDQITAGFKGQLNAVWSTELRLGWRETEYDAFEGEQVVENFSGVIIDGDLTWDLAHGSSIRLDLLRSDFPSNFGVNAYYTATRGVLTYNLDRGKFFGLLRGRFQNNDYAVPDVATGDDRSDDITSFNLGLGYRFTNLFSLYGSYLYEDRSSSINRFGYTTNIYTIGLTIGY